VKAGDEVLVKAGDEVLVKATVVAVDANVVTLNVARGPLDMPVITMVFESEIVVPPKPRPAQNGRLSDRQWIALDMLYLYGLHTPYELARNMTSSHRMTTKNGHPVAVKIPPVSVHSAGATMGSLISRGYAERLYGPKGLIRYGITMAGKKARDREAQ
jgi:hypothetical protein